MLKRLKKTFILLLSLCMVLGLSVFLAACGEDETANQVPPAAVDATTIKYDGSTFTWDAVDGAKSYKLDINGNSYTESATKHPYSCTNFKADAYSITITCVNDWGQSDAISKTFSQLPTMDEKAILFSEEGVMSWEAVEMANMYIVNVNGTDHEVGNLEFSDFEYGKTNTIKIKPVGPDDTYFALWSKPLTKSYLGAPTDIKYDGQFITWKGSVSAKSYTVFVNDNEFQTVTGTSMQYAADRDDFSVSVRANGDGDKSFDSKISENVNYIFLDLVTDMHVREGYVEWTAIEGADAYEVKIGGRTERTTEPRFKLTAGSTQMVSVRPVSTKADSHFFSDWNDEEPFYILRTPTLQWDANQVADGNDMKNLYWTAVPDAQSYQIHIVMPNNVEDDRTTPNTDATFSFGYTEEGTYRIKVMAIGNETEGKYNSAYTPEITVIRLAPPTAAPGNFISSDPEDLDEGFHINVQPVSGASGYKLWKAGGDTGITSQTTSLRATQVTEPTETREMHITYAVQSIGSGRKNVGETFTVTLNSLTKSNLAAEVTVLKRPEDVSIAGNVMTWTADNTASGYAINLSGTRYTAIDNSYTLNPDPGTYELSVCAKGDGKAVLPSRYTSKITVLKLQAPWDIHVDVGMEEGQLKYQGPSEAASYQIYMNNSETPEEGNTIKDVSQFIEDNATTVQMKSVGSGFNNDKTRYVLDSNMSDPVIFTQLMSVTFGDRPFTNTTLSWNAPQNASGANIHYEVYNNFGSSVGTVESTQYDISNAPAGDLVYRVRAFGDGYRFINSSKDDIPTASITKLKTPKVDRKGVYYTWDDITDAERYSVQIEGQNPAMVPAGSSPCKFEPTVFTEVGFYDVSITAVGNGRETIDSAPCVINQQVKKLDVPTFTIDYVNSSNEKEHSDTVVNNGGILISVTNNVANATGYLFTVGDTSRQQSLNDGLEYFYRTDASTTYNVSVTAVGGAFGEGDNAAIYYVNSAPASTQSMTLMGTLSDISVSDQGMIRWTAPSDARYGYDLIICVGGVEKSVHVTTNSCDIRDRDKDLFPNYQDGQLQWVKIRVCGNGTNVISSDYKQFNR